MGKYRLFYWPFFFFSLCAQSQDRMLTMEEAVLGTRGELAPQNIEGLKWIKDTDDWCFMDSTGMVLMRESIQQPAAPLVTTGDLNTAFKDILTSALKSFPGVTWTGPHTFSFKAESMLCAYDTRTGKGSVVIETELSDAAPHKDMHDKTLAIAYTSGNDLYIQKNGKSIRVTDDGSDGIVNGQVVHRYEFGISKGTFWSPDGSRLAFYRKDETMVTTYPVNDYSTRPAGPRLVRYPMAGDSSHHVTVGVYSLSTGKTTWLQTGTPRDQYLTNIAWSPDNNLIYVAVLNRGQDHLRLNQYDASTGVYVKTLFEEKNDKYVQPLHAMEFLPGKGDRFIWQSRRNGWNHLYLYSTSGKLIRQLTRGAWEVMSFEGLDEKGRHAYFTSTAGGAVNRDLHRVSMTGRMTRLTRGAGTHGITLNDAKTLFIDRFSSVEVPRTIRVSSVDGIKHKELLAAPDPLADYLLGDMRMFRIPNGHGDDLQCRMFLPPAFDSTKTYPCIIYVYNGPNIQLIRNRWLGGANLWFHYMAQRGYIMFTVDGRGSANRGLAFEQSLFRQLGVVEREDQMAGVAWLRSRPYIDTERMGVHGWSYGGYMTTGLVTRHPDVFRAAVAGGTVTDWKYYEVMYTERYMDTPEENPAGYAESELMPYVDSLDCPLLMIHGTGDDVVVLQHSMMYLKKAIEAGKQVAYFAYPDYKHNVRGPDRVHLMEMITRFFEEHL